MRNTITYTRPSWFDCFEAKDSDGLACENGLADLLGDERIHEALKVKIKFTLRPHKRSKAFTLIRDGEYVDIERNENACYGLVLDEIEWINKRISKKAWERFGVVEGDTTKLTVHMSWEITE